MIVDCISDCHGFYPELEGGDLLIVAGDLTRTDAPHEYNRFARWMANQEYKKKIVIAGNHDNWIVESSNLGIIGACEIGNFDYLCDSGTEFNYWREPTLEEKQQDSYGSLWKVKKSIKIWGSPWTKRFPRMNPHCMAFTMDTEKELEVKWALIPDDIDILVTHSPPYGIKDETIDGLFVGSKTLVCRVVSMKNPPKLWVWGHIHESYGIDMPIRAKDCKMVNASHVNEHYQPVNKPIRVIL